MRQRRAKHERRLRAQMEARLPAPRRAWLKAVFALVVLAAAGAIATVVALSRAGDSSVSTRAGAASQPGGSPLTLRGTDPVSGREVNLVAFAGKPLVVNIWASWCTGCAAEARALTSFERTHPEAQVVGIDIQDTKAGANAFYRRFGWRHPSIFDPSGSLAAQLGLQGLPTTIFLDRRHRIVARIVGETDLAGFTAGLRRATT